MENNKVKFIDLFAGVGGFHLAFKNAPAECVFACEIDSSAQQTYALNFPQTPLFNDIAQFETQTAIPTDFNFLCGGFPCQPFSVAGQQKGFEDSRGTLFFEIGKIVQKHRPAVLLLENVDNLKTHDDGRTFAVIIKTLKDLGYGVSNKVLNPATHANIPQNRPRVFIVALDRAQIKGWAEFEFPSLVTLTKTIHDCLEKGKVDDRFYYNEDSQYYELLKNSVIKKDTIYQLRRVYVRENKSKVCPALTASMGTGGHNVPLILDDYGIRKLTPRECFNFQGFPNDFKLPDIALNELYKQAGNAVCVPLVQKIVEKIITDKLFLKTEIFNMESKMIDANDNNILTTEILTDLLCHDISPAVSYTKNGMHIKLTPDMECWFEQENVTNEPELMEKQQEFNELFMPYALSFCYNDDLCPWYSIGLTSAPCAMIEGITGYEEHPPKYVFAYFCNYQVKDWVEELREHGEVTFETFIDFSKEYALWNEKRENEENIMWNDIEKNSKKYALLATQAETIKEQTTPTKTKSRGR